MRRGGGQTVWRSVGRLASALRSAGPPVRLTALLLLSACQPAARRLLLLDLALSDPVLLNGTARPWRDQGYTVEYRRFYPHLARADLERYRVLLFLLGREPEAPSDALTVGDLALLTEWVLRGGVVVLGYDADGEGYLDRWTANRWLESVGTGISIGDRLLEDTTARVLTTTGRPQPWAEGRAMGDEPLGSVFDPFPLDRNDVVTTRDSSQLIAVSSRHAFVRIPRTPAPRPRAGVVAATRIGDGLVVVASRHALGALGPQFRSTTAPLQQLDALERTHEFLGALARWTRRPAEWAHVPPAARGGPLVLEQAPVPVEVAPPAMAPPGGVDTIALPLLPDPKLARATSTPEWLQQQGMRVLWTPLFATRDGRRVMRSGPSLGWPRSSARSSLRSVSTSGRRAATRWARSSATRRGGAGWRFSSERARRGEAGTRSRTPPATRRCATPACYPGTTAPWRTRLPPAPRRSGIACCGSAGTSTSRSGWRNRRPIGSRSACSAASRFRTGRCSCSHRSYGPATCSRSTARAASTSYTRSPSFRRRSGHATGPASSGRSSAKVTGSGW